MYVIAITSRRMARARNLLSDVVQKTFGAVFRFLYLSIRWPSRRVRPAGTFDACQNLNGHPIQDSGLWLKTYKVQPGCTFSD